jgi:hypothetical protein
MESAASFKSAKELRSLLDSVLEQIDSDPVAGAKMRAAAAPVRLEFPDLKVSVDISAAEDRRHYVSWSFKADKAGAPKPGLHMTMDSEIGNRFLQGRENPAIALVRGRMRVSCGNTVAAVRFFPAAKPLFERYREVVRREHPSLLLD